MSEQSVEDVIAAYRRELYAEADLSGRPRRDQDHLRSLTEELCGTGMPALEAVTEAARRLGDPRALAREHARVRGAFGAKLSRARRISVAVCLAPLLWHLGISAYLFGATSQFDAMLPIGTMFACGVVLVSAVLAGISWARPVLLGGMAFSVALVALALVEMHQQELLDGRVVVLYLVDVASVAFLVPWRRSELTPPGWTLVLLGGVSAIAMLADLSLAVFVSAFVAIIGCILRARWSALASAVSTVLVAISLARTENQRSIYDERTLLDFGWIALTVIGILAAALATLHAWRSSNSLRKITR